MSGYNKLAALLGAHPEVAIFRRFAALNCQNILYLQAELVSLEARLRKYEENDKSSSEGLRAVYGRNWYDLSNSVNDSGGSQASGNGSQASEPGFNVKTGPETWQWKTALLLRKKLKEYNEAVLQQAAFTELAHPSQRDLKFLKRWMDDEDMGSISLIGRDRQVYKDPDELDLFVMKQRPNESFLTSWLTNVFVDWLQQKIIEPCKRKLRPAPEPNNAPLPPPFRLDTIAQQTGTVEFSQTALLRFGRMVAMSLSSVIPIVSIVVLHYVESTPKRLGIVAAFTAAFSFILGLVTNGKPIEVFSASAAFAAVLVVFVGTDAGQSG